MSEKKFTYVRLTIWLVNAWSYQLCLFFLPLSQVPDEAVSKCTACGTDFGPFVRKVHIS